MLLTGFIMTNKLLTMMNNYKHEPCFHDHCELVVKHTQNRTKHNYEHGNWPWCAITIFWQWSLSLWQWFFPVKTMSCHCCAILLKKDHCQTIVIVYSSRIHHHFINKIAWSFHDWLVKFCNLLIKFWPWSTMVNHMTLAWHHFLFYVIIMTSHPVYTTVCSKSTNRISCYFFPLSCRSVREHARNLTGRYFEASDLSTEQRKCKAICCKIGKGRKKSILRLSLKARHFKF